MPAGAKSPGNVNFTAVQDVTSTAMPTAKMRLTAHNSDTVCAACHRITDPLGLPLQKFDGIGAFRRQENGAPIDTAGLFEGTAFQGNVGLGKALAASKSTTECVAGRAFQYATGRVPEDDGVLAGGIEQDFAKDGYRIASLFLRVATMPQAYRIAATPLATPKIAMTISKGVHP